MQELKQEQGISIVRAARIMCVSTSAVYYQSKKDDSEVIAKLQALAELKPTRGCDYYYGRIRNEGLIWNHKRVKRVYNQLGLNIRRKRKRKLPDRQPIALVRPQKPNQMWSMDFMSDALECGRKFRTLNIIDEFNSEVLAIEVDFSLPAQRVIRTLEKAFWCYGKPGAIRVDNGPEFISNALEIFCNEEKNQIKLSFIQKGKPTQNAYVERFNRTFREDTLDAYLFRTIDQARTEAEWFREDYNNNHPHEALHGMSPIGYRRAVESGKLAAQRASLSLPHCNSDANNNTVNNFNFKHC